MQEDSNMSEYQDGRQIRDLAEQLMEEKRYDEAIELYEKLHEMNPLDESIVMALAWAYRDNGRTADAIKALERLFEKELSRQTFTGFAFDELVRIFRSEGKFEELVNLCERAVAAQPDDVSLLVTLGDSCLKAGKTGRAIEVFEKLARMDPDAPSVFCALGDAYIASGDFTRGEGAYERAVALEPADAASFYYRMSNSYFGAEIFDRAEKAVRKSLAHSPYSPLYFCALGDILIKQGKFDEGVSSYDKAIDIDPHGAGVYCNRLGKAFAKDQHHEKAIAAFERAIHSDPKNPFYYLCLMDSCAEEGFDEKAREYYEKAKSLNVFS